MDTNEELTKVACNSENHQSNCELDFLNPLLVYGQPYQDRMFESNECTYGSNYQVDVKTNMLVNKDTKQDKLVQCIDDYQYKWKDNLDR